MLRDERLRRITEMVNSNGEAKVSELAKVYNVSYDTIERDLDLLHGKEEIRRVHGGASRFTASVDAGGTSAIRTIPLASTTVIQALRELIKSGQTIVLDSGPIALQLARDFPINLRTNVITNSPAIAVMLADASQVDVRVIGGRLRDGSLTPTGREATEAIELLEMTRADLCILGPCNIALPQGITVDDSEDAKLKRAMISNASIVLAAILKENLGRLAGFIVGQADRLTYLVPLDDIATDELKAYEDIGIEMIWE
jgi:DeoR/GlpR family transcriptional regulator of sugar metabolism